MMRIVEKDGKDAANKAMADAEVAGKIIVKILLQTSSYNKF